MAKEKAHLFTQDIVGACRWANTAPISQIKPEKLGDLPEGTTWRTKAFMDLKNKLGRVSGDFPVAAQNGVSFERALYAEALNDTNVGSDMFKELVAYIRGGNFQHKLKQDYSYRGMNIFLYGKEDVRFEGTEGNTFHPGKKIIDIKTTANFKNKYHEGFQHILYAFVDQIESFEYIVAEWDMENGGYPLIKAIHYIPIKIDLKKAEARVNMEIDFCFNFMKEYKLWDLYRETYCMY